MQPALGSCHGEKHLVLYLWPQTAFRDCSLLSSTLIQQPASPFMSPGKQDDTVLYLTLDGHPSARKNVPRRCTPHTQAWSHRVALRIVFSLVVILCIFQFRLWSLDMDDSSSDKPQSIYTVPRHDHLRYAPRETPAARTMPPSTWTCTLEGDSSLDAKKSRQCVVQHVCVDDEGRQSFFISFCSVIL